MKRLLTVLLTATMSVMMVVPTFAAANTVPVRRDLDAMTEFCFSEGTQFKDIEDEHARVLAIANYIKDNYVWDLNFSSGVEALKEGRTGHFSYLYECMLTECGITVIGSCDSHAYIPEVDITQPYAQDLVIEIDGVRYWSSPLMYKYYGEDYLLRTDIPNNEMVGANPYDLEMNLVRDLDPEIIHEVTGVVLGSCLED